MLSCEAKFLAVGWMGGLRPGTGPVAYDELTFPKKVAFFSFIGDVGAEIVFEGGAGA